MSVDTLPSLAESRDWLPWAHQLEQCWLQVLGLERATVTLTIEEASAWETYLYQCELISRSLSDHRMGHSDSNRRMYALGGGGLVGGWVGVAQVGGFPACMDVLGGAGDHQAIIGNVLTHHGTSGDGDIRANGEGGDEDAV